MPVLSMLSWGIFVFAIVSLYDGRICDLLLRFKKFFLHLYLRRLARKKTRGVALQLADALTMISNSLKAGLGLEQSIEFASQELPFPIRAELEDIMAQVRLGSRLEEALAMADQRLQITDFSIVVQSIEALRETGGSLTEVFDSITNVIRERMKIEENIKSYTAQGMMQAYTLLMMPFALGLMLSLISKDYLMPLFQEPLGMVLISFGVVLQIIGGIWMRRIVRISV